MSRRTVRLVVTLVLVLGVLGFLFRHEANWPAFTLAPGALIAMSFAVLYSPRAREFIRAHSRLMQFGGWGFAALALVTGIGALSVFPELDKSPYQDIAIWVAAFGALTGLFAAGMGRMVGNYESAIAAATMPRSEIKDFSGPRLGLASVTAPFTAPWLLALTTLPWAIPVAAVPLVMFWMAASGHLAALAGDARDVDARTFLFLWEAIVLGVLGLFAMPAALVAWHRRMLASRRPFGASALKAYGRTFYLVLAVGFVTGALMRFVSPNAADIARLLHISDVAAITQTLYDAVVLFAILVLSPGALVISAFVIGDRDTDRLASARIVRPRWRSFAAGLLVAIGPYLALRWGIGMIVDRQSIPVALALVFADQALLFAGLGAASTYLARTYLAVRPT